MRDCTFSELTQPLAGPERSSVDRQLVYRRLLSTRVTTTLFKTAERSNTLT